MQRALNVQADQIERVLYAHKVPARVLGGLVTPRWVRFEVLPAANARLSSLTRLSEEIALWLGSRSVRICRRADRVHIEVPRPQGQLVRLLPLVARLQTIPRQSAILGLDEDGIPLLLRLPSPEVGHVLLAGTTGSGKTALARTMLLSLAMHNRLGEVQLVIIDPKGRSFSPLEALPHLLYPVAHSLEAAHTLLERLVQEMMRRDQLALQEPRLIILIDELADLVTAGGADIVRTITRLTQRGREAGLHVIGCTQKPTVEAIGSLVKSNFPVRLVGSVASPEDGRVATGLKGAGAEQLMGRRDFLLVIKGEVVRFQAAYVSDREARWVAQQLCQGHRTSRRWEAALLATSPEFADDGNTSARSPATGKLRAFRP